MSGGSRVSAEAARSFFAPGSRVFWGEAPGRIDLYGGIADYSGSLVLEMPLERTTRVGLAWSRARTLRVQSREFGQVCLPLEVLADPSGQPRSIEPVRRHFDQLGEDCWVAHVAGCCLLLARHSGRSLRGADLFVASDVPPNRGLAASAALEVATLRALGKATGVELSGRGGLELAFLAQRVENEAVGAPCGIMDQAAVHLGRPGALLPILCQPCTVETPISLPADLRVLAVDSGVRHSVGGGRYGNVRTAAFMGYSIIAREAGAGSTALLRAHAAGDRGDDARAELPFGGYLANVPPRLFEERFRQLLPVEMTGREFLDAGHVLIDRFTCVDPGRHYRVRAATTHPIHENDRIHVGVSLLRLVEPPERCPAAQREVIWSRLGELLYQANEGYSACGLGTDATDRIVALARRLGRPRPGAPSGGPGGCVYGARVSGGGSGGTVVLLCSASFDSKRLEEGLEGTGAALLSI